jgi:hypothetical protein
MRSAPFWVIKQRVVVIPYRRFGTTYRSQLQGSRKHNEKAGTCGQEGLFTNISKFVLTEWVSTVVSVEEAQRDVTPRTCYTDVLKLRYLEPICRRQCFEKTEEE